MNPIEIIEKIEDQVLDIMNVPAVASKPSRKIDQNVRISDELIRESRDRDGNITIIMNADQSVQTNIISLSTKVLKEIRELKKIVECPTIESICFDMIKNGETLPNIESKVRNIVLNIAYRITGTHRKAAKMIGVSRETVSRIIRETKKNEISDRTDGQAQDDPTGQQTDQAEYHPRDEAGS